jgi:predicted RNA-binding Zn-ribbon protein involved in translation (DUF1610 family)
MVLSDAAKKHVLLALVVVCGIGAAWHVFFRRPPDATGQAPRLDVICSSCGWEGRVAIKGGWHRCPGCHENTVHLAAVCPRCRKVMPFLDDELYLKNSVTAMNEHAAEVLPVCPECKVQATPKWAAFPKLIRAGE